jgi:tripeptidyl-peptidase-1
MGPEVGESHEVAAQSQAGGLITTGGGFSMYFQTAEWQRTVVDDYLTYFPHIQPGYNPNGRGYPNISLIGVDYAVMVDGEWSTIFGTSCVAPMLAGWISLINAARQQWMNPTLYNVGYNQSKQLPNAYRAAFRDVTSGHNRCCHSSSTSNLKPTCCASGFVATCGRDPLTGWGSIAFPSLLTMFGP